MKLNKTKIVQMPRRMRTALNQFLCDVLKKKKNRRSLYEKFVHLKKTNDLLFLRFQTSVYFEGGPPGQMSPMPISLTRPCWSSGYFLKLDTSC